MSSCLPSKVRAHLTSFGGGAERPLFLDPHVPTWLTPLKAEGVSLVQRPGKKRAPWQKNEKRPGNISGKKARSTWSETDSACCPGWQHHLALARSSSISLFRCAAEEPLVNAVKWRTSLSLPRLPVVDRRLKPYRHRCFYGSVLVWPTDCSCVAH